MHDNAKRTELKAFRKCKEGGKVWTGFPEGKNKTKFKGRCQERVVWFLVGFFFSVNVMCVCTECFLFLTHNLDLLLLGG